MRATRTHRHLAAVAVSGLVVLSLTSCKSAAGTVVGDHAKPVGVASAAASSAAGTAAEAASAVPSVLPSGVASTVTGKVTGVAGAAAGTVGGVRSAAGTAAGKAVAGASGTCAVSGLKGSVSIPNAASGINVGNLPGGILATVVSLVNTTDHSCVLSGWTGLTPIAVGNALAGVKATNVGSPAPGAVTIAAGGTAYVGASFTSAAGCPTLQDVALTIPGESGVLQIPVSTATGTHQPLTVCPGVSRISPVTPDLTGVLSLLR
ncbi:hypothetical protein ABIA33_003924 [Streptacidiphilus sp. MAP12-16]|uniref:hypothetical protein n=1 Tax=Streptacidiphilus sp. MAP12-16 TaxID=3156300 RepID=UPI003512E4A0